jgi:aldehyde:ferredoxin oxidoreductase
MDGVAEHVKNTQDERAVCFSLVLCDFLPFDVAEMVDLLNSATGFSFTQESYLRTGERIWTLVRLFNVREGTSSKDDTLPDRFANEKLPEGDGQGLTIPEETLESAKAEYYSLRGWSKNGTPTEELLRFLEL